MKTHEHIINVMMTRHQDIKNRNEEKLKKKHETMSDALGYQE